MAENIYRKKCEEFCKKYKVSMEILEKKKMFWFDDPMEQKRNVYKIKLKKGRKSWTIHWADSVINTEMKQKPEIYDVLSSISKFEAKDYKRWCKKYNFDHNEEKYKLAFEKMNREVEDGKRFFEDAWKEFQEII